MELFSKSALNESVKTTPAECLNWWKDYISSNKPAVYKDRDVNRKQKLWELQCVLAHAPFKLSAWSPSPQSMPALSHRTPSLQEPAHDDNAQLEILKQLRTNDRRQLPQGLRSSFISGDVAWEARKATWCLYSAGQCSHWLFLSSDGKSMEMNHNTKKDVAGAKGSEANGPHWVYHLNIKIGVLQLSALFLMDVAQ